MEYYIEDLINKALINVRSNKYGIKDSFHSLKRVQNRGIDLNVIIKNIHQGKLVGVEKSLNQSNIFKLLYEHTQQDDLGIVINIMNEDEIFIMTVMESNVNKRRHYEY